MAKTRITIVGCGFMGTAIAIALRSLYKDIEIVGHDKDQSKTQRAEKMKAIDRSNWNLPSACENAQLIVLAIPIGAIEPTLRAIAPDIIPGAIITDTCTTKVPLAGFVSKYLPAHAAYISSDIIFNPTKLTPTQKVETLTVEVFKGASWALTPIVATPSSVDSFAGLVSAVGAKPIFMDAIEHDGLRLSVDGIPAALSSALMLAITGDAAWRERQWLAGSTFDAATINVDSTDADEVASVLVAQKEATTHWLNQIMVQLIEIRDAVEQDRSDKVAQYLSIARERREEWAANWFKGRDEGYVPVDSKKPSLLGMFVGSGMASRIEDNANRNQPGNKNKPKR